MSNDRCYEPSVLKKKQDALLSVYKEVSRICDKHNITLFAEGGTALGAVRHGGFIPWDDDVDVFVMREDYDKLLEILPQELDEKFAVDDWLSNKDFPAPDACIYLKNSVSVPVEMKNCKYRYGIGIGIYPYDNMPDDDKKAKAQLRACWFWTRIHWLKVLPFPYVPYKGILRAAIYTVCGAAHIALKLVPKKWIVDRCEKATRRYNNTETRRAGILTYVYPWDTVLEKAKIYPPHELMFEDLTVRIPACWDEWLTQLYGDYMQLPPEDQRKNHFPCVFKFPDE